MIDRYDHPEGSTVMLNSSGPPMTLRRYVTASGAHRGERERGMRLGVLV